MAVFREADRICVSLEELLLIAPPLKEIISPLLRALEADSLSSFYRILCGISRIEREYLSTFIREKESVQGGVITQSQWNLMKDFACQYPGDPAILSPLFLILPLMHPLAPSYKAATLRAVATI
jgi:hypothetical protein